MSTWTDIVSNCKDNWARSINVGSKPRREAIIEADALLREGFHTVKAAGDLVGDPSKARRIANLLEIPYTIDGVLHAPDND